MFDYIFTFSIKVKIKSKKKSSVMEMSLFNCISTCLILTILTCNQIQLLGTKNPSSDSFNKIHQVFKYMKCWEEKDSSINLDNNSSKSLYCSLEKCKGLVGKKKKKECIKSEKTRQKQENNTKGSLMECIWAGKMHRKVLAIWQEDTKGLWKRRWTA